MKTTIVLLGVLLVALSCNKGNEIKGPGLLFKRSELKGKAILKDDYAQTPSVVAPDVVIYVALNDKADPYLYKADTTDKEGKFVISFQPTTNEASLHLVARYTDKAGLTYGASYLIKDLPPSTTRNEIELTLTPVYQKNVIKVKVVDKGTAKQPVAKAEVFLFLNENHAETFRDDKPKGIVYQRTTNELGVAFFPNLELVEYFVRAKVTRAEGLATASDRATAVPAPSSATVLPVKELQLTYPTTKSSLKVAFLYNQVLKEPLANFTAYLFTSQVQAESVKTDLTPVGFVDQKITDAKGIVTFSGLEGKSYYVGLRGVLPRKDTLRYVSPLFSFTIVEAKDTTIHVR